MRVLLLLDGSTEAVDESLSLARERGAELCALFVQDGGWRGFTGNDWLSTSKSYTGFLEYVDNLENDEARRTVEHLLRRASAHGLEPRVKLARGDVSKETLTELKEGYDLLVMAHPLRRGLESLRGAGERIIKGAPCSVFLVKTPGQPGRGQS